MTFKSQIISLLIAFLIFIPTLTFAQNSEFKKGTLKASIALGYNEGQRENGIGLMYGLGWQKSIDEKDRFRINPQMHFGGFLPLPLSESRDQYYRITTWGMYIHYDLIRYKSVSFVTSAGAFISFSRGILGTGGDPEAHYYTYSEHFYHFYLAGNVAAGIRINPPKSRFAIEIIPLNLSMGTNEFVLGNFMVCLAYKFKN